MVIIINSEDDVKSKTKKDVSKIKKPNIDRIYQDSAREISDMFRDSKEKLDKEYEKFLRKE